MNVFENDSYQLYMEYENMINNDLCNMMEYVCKITYRYFLCMALPDGSECFFMGGTARRLLWGAEDFSSFSAWLPEKNFTAMV